MKVYLHITQAFKSLHKSLKRYPITIALSTLTTIILIILSHKQDVLIQSTRQGLIKLAMVTALGIPLSLCINHLLKRINNVDKKIKLLYNLLGFILLTVYYLFFLPDFKMLPITRFIALNLMLYLVFICIPYIIFEAGFELYVVSLLSRFFTTFLYSVILFIGVAAILFTVNHLLAIPISGELYYDLLLLIVGIFAPSFFLAGIPMSGEELSEKDYPKFLKLLLIYIIIPLLAAYTTILYIYFLKLIITLKWPVQLVMHLVLWYSIISIVVIFLTSILCSQSKWVKIFNLVLIKAILPLQIMMFASLGKRINSFGITENRYYVGLLGLWLLGVFVYLNLSKKKYNVILPITLSIIVFLSVLGPINVYNISKYSQNKRLQSILLHNGMLSQNKIIPAKNQISLADKNEIESILYYFSNKYSLREVKYLPKNFSFNDIDMKKVFGFTTITPPYNDISSNYFSYYANSQGFPLNISGYDYLVSSNDLQSKNGTINGNIEISYNSATTSLVITKNKHEIYNYLISSYGGLLYKKYGNGNKQLLSPLSMMFTDENKAVKVRFVFQSLNGHIDVQSNEPKIDYPSFYLLIKLK